MNSDHTPERLFVWFLGEPQRPELVEFVDAAHLLRQRERFRTAAPGRSKPPSKPRRGGTPGVFR